MGKLLPVVFILFFLGTFFHRYFRLYEQNWVDRSASSELIDTPLSTPKVASLLITEKISLDELTKLLVADQLITDTLTFKWISKTHGWRSFQKGFYTFSRDESIDESLRRMGLGLQDTIPITILPGQTKGSLSGSLARQLEADSVSFDQLLGRSLVSESQEAGDNQLSQMLPDTYYFFWNTSPEKVVERIAGEFERVITELRSNADESVQHLSDADLVILASIIEWEARFEDEKPTISGLYHNRLRKGMKLQADPTVNYALGERRRLLYRDYQLQHPYNTYVINGLPPGPITNPSYSSLKAAYQPESHDYLFMVATPEGRHEFNVTYQDHLVSAEKWQQWIREQFRIKRQAEREASQTTL